MPPVEEPAPNLDVAEWVQGEASNVDREQGRVILIEVFQVNCPGCFIGGLPEAIEVYRKFRDRPLVVWGLATAFEDFGLNTLDNLKRLVQQGEVVGATQMALLESGQLEGGRLPYTLPFPVAWDKVVKRSGEATPEEIDQFLARDFPDHENMPGYIKDQVKSQIKTYLSRKQYDARTFDRYGLRGTPSSILIDKKGVLRHKLFGSGQGLETHVQQLLDE